ncbi:deleted in malignant brain tumors 1 protein-like [Rhea pennata]|uniref:deleted in malignant brain tumors 1 protein-like n=1 Tax=Rhea pennata TaxID=8795 RepID=UPI002E25C6C7
MVLSWMVMISLGIQVDTDFIIADELLLRLAGGPNRCAGNVEIFYFGGWMKVCGHLWDMRDAEVACRQLGCGQPLGVTGYFRSPDWSPYVMSAVDCQGSEEYLWACPYEHTSSCSDRDASVVCSDSGLTAPPTTGSLSSTSLMPPTSGFFSCGGLLWDSSGSFQSPNYPSAYPNNAHCVWRIRSWQANYRVNLIFLDVELEGSSCQYDAIEVYDSRLPGGPLLGTVCSNNHHEFLSSGNELAVLFRSDGSVTRKGFRASYYSIPPNTTPDSGLTSSPPAGSLSSTSLMPPTSGFFSCGGLLWDSSGSFQSPNYPSAYPNNAHCVWRIRSWQANYRVNLIFLDVELEGSSCQYDAIEVYDGRLPGGPLLGTVCSNNHHEFLSSGNELAVLFRSDGSVTRKGFRAFYNSSLPNTTPASYSCGGLLSYSSGTLQSPFYPGNYPDNADCVWEIQVLSNFRVTLTFRDIQMQGGRCLSDYVEIYDGPLRTSPLLGKICSGSFRTYTSSSNLMTVHFHSNSRYTYRGFQADYYSIPADQSTTLLCLPDYMHTVVSRAFLQSEGYSTSNLTLNDSYCKPTITSQYVIFNIPYNSCGTVRKGNNNTIIYSNLIRGFSSGSVITRHKRLHLHVNCKMLQNTWTQKMYVAEDNFEVNETQYSRYDVNLTFYHTASFSRPVYDSPYYVDINQDLFLEARLHSSDSDLMLFVDTCVASPDPYDFTAGTYDLIRNGCVKDSTYTKYYSPNTHVARFKFSAFQFVHNYPSVYLRCEFVVCRVYDYSSRCYQGCITRSKKEANSAQERVNVVAGPIQLREAGAENRNAELDSFGIQEGMNSAPAPADFSHTPFIIAVMALTVAVFILVGFLLKHKPKKPIPYQVM